MPSGMRPNGFFSFPAEIGVMREHRDLFLRFLRDDEAATAIEYCLIAGTVVIAVVVGVTQIGTKLNHFLVQIVFN